MFCRALVLQHVKKLTTQQRCAVPKAEAISLDSWACLILVRAFGIDVNVFKATGVNVILVALHVEYN